MNTGGIVALLVALVVAGVIAVALRWRDGRLRASRAAAGGWALAGHPPTATDRVLLLQLSSPICTPCRQTAGVLTELTSATPGLVHVELDVADRPDVARELGVMRTPTVVAFDRDGHELLRLSGVPKAAELAAAVAPRLTD